MILASQSPRRIELMREAGYDVVVEPADIDETPLPVYTEEPEENPACDEEDMMPVADADAVAHAAI